MRLLPITGNGANFFKEGDKPYWNDPKQAYDEGKKLDPQSPWNEEAVAKAWELMPDATSLVVLGDTLKGGPSTGHLQPVYNNRFILHRFN